jgi:hypothetical protein
MADAALIRRRNWAGWLISAGVLGLALVLVFYRLGHGIFDVLFVVLF